MVADRVVFVALPLRLRPHLRDGVSSVSIGFHIEFLRLVACGSSRRPATPTMQLSRFRRVRICHSPTPLERLPRLTDLLGRPRLYIKRDDCTGLATAGNKTRKLEFPLGAATAENADTAELVTGDQ
jgi:hypothetical protein